MGRVCNFTTSTAYQRSEKDQIRSGPHWDADLTVKEFVRWLAQIGEMGPMSRRQLVIIFSEFCDYYELLPLTEGQLLRRTRTAGIERYRLTTGSREWRYRLQAATALDFGN